VSIGLLGLLDDIAGIAKVAAASIDDVGTLALKAGVKATGAVIDDAAVTPRYVEGFAAEREFPIVARIAIGSLRNKLLFLLPAALLLSFLLPGLITPLLMIGGAYLCYEGAEKVFHALMPHQAEHHEGTLTPVALNAQTLEDQKVASAVKTDFILSAEIMTIALSAIPETNVWTQAFILALVGVGITFLVYGAVALIVKADDLGLAMARNGANSLLGQFSRSFGRGLVKAMPGLMTTLGIVGTAAMIWVGGSIIVHGLHEFGIHAPSEFIEHASAAAAATLPGLSGILAWLVTSALDGVVGLVLGMLLIPISGYVISPLWGGLKGLLPKKAAT